MIGERLRLLREKQGKQQIEIADALGISRVTYNRYEKDNREPNLETLIKIADYFSVTTDFLLGIENEKQHLLNVYFSLSQEDKNTVLSIAERLNIN